MKLKVKKILKLIIMNVAFVMVMGTSNFAYEERLVDIPVPPNSSGYADFTSEEAEQRAKEYEQNKETAEDYIAKSGDNYLKSLKVEGYELAPEFNSQESEYKLYIKNKNNTNTIINIIAEANDEKARIEGAGSVDIKPDQEVITINVIAENGNLRVYVIRIEDEINKPNGIHDASTLVALGTAVIILGIVGGITIKNHKKSKKS